ncbi:hydrolase [Caulobacter sp. CCUG 60055]|uniref:amidohydrolase family protein n=2 Tax=Pseudomonadota TaxID=1224 RepID=UPI001FA6CDA6|nr:amidohydrolase family protein [Caulobacter sp. CCUG 60055]MBQ1542698.1 amidohydrolase family protein [Caulobacteraceae bacterium]MCI3179498.1 hydrolase [Caulobacter sp. CCUG 60055]
MRRPLLGLTAGLAALACAWSAGAAPARVVYRNANLIDSVSGTSRPGMSILIEGETIKAVAPDAGLSQADLAGAQAVDLHGQYVLPGLIDSHEHLLAPNRRAGQALLRRDVYAGVTAIRDMADDLRGVADLARASRAGEIPAPDIYYAALMGGPGLFANPRIAYLSEGWTPGTAPWAQAVTPKTDVRLAVAVARGTGATAVKLYTDIPAPLVRALAAEAHRQGLKVWTHAAILPALPLDAVEAGADSLSHVCDLAYQAADRPPRIIFERTPVPFDKLSHGDDPQITAVFEAMRRRGTILDATNRTYVESDKHQRPGQAPICTAEVSARLTAQALRQGVAVSTGTDGFAPPDDLFPPLYDELEFLADKVGMTPAQVIHSATVVGARATGQPEALGQIAPGRLADLMIVEKNPLEDIRNLRTVTLTVKRGRAYPRSEFQPLSVDELR